MKYALDTMTTAVKQLEFICINNKYIALLCTLFLSQWLNKPIRFVRWIPCITRKIISHDFEGNINEMFFVKSQELLFELSLKQCGPPISIVQSAKPERNYGFEINDIDVMSHEQWNWTRKFVYILINSIVSVVETQMNEWSWDNQRNHTPTIIYVYYK